MAKPKSKKSFVTTLKDWGLALMLALIFVFLIHCFLFESLVVNSQKMERTLYNGDYIYVDKVSYGARLPITLLSLPFTGIYSPAITLPYLRMPGFNAIGRNDLVVFNYPAQFDPPIDKKETMVKRCIALPGDSIQIIKKKILINHQSFDESPSLQFTYRVVMPNSKADAGFLKKYGITEGGKVNEVGIYDLTMDTATVRRLENNAEIQSIRELKEFPGENVTLYFPNSLIHNWNRDNMGPILVPQKGMAIALNQENFYVYNTIIETYEGNTIYKKGSEVYVNNVLATQYTFKQNYFFVLDDNRDNAKDSRYWGFLPESHIIGKAWFVWFSVDKQNGKIRWNRFFKKLE